MPWCPRCTTEYRDGFTICTDCGAKLVDKLPETQECPNTGRPAKPVRLMHCPSTFDADATLALLRSFDIPCFSQPDMGAEKAYTGFSMTGETIYVEQAQLGNAREIVRGFRRGRGYVDASDVEKLLAQAPDPPAADDPVSDLLSSKLPRIALFLLGLSSIVSILLFRMYG